MPHGSQKLSVAMVLTAAGLGWSYNRWTTPWLLSLWPDIARMGRSSSLGLQSRLVLV